MSTPVRPPRSGVERALPWLVGLASLGVSAVWLARGLSPPERLLSEASTPPLSAEAAAPWLAELSARTPRDPMQPAWRSMVDHPEVVMAWRDDLLHAAPGPTEAWALAVFGHDPAWLRHLADHARLPVDLAAVLLRPEATEAVASACPIEEPSLTPLCGEVAAEQRRLDAALASWLGSADPTMRLWSLEAACAGGPTRAAAIADLVEDGVVGVEPPEVAPGLALLVRGCGLAPTEAVRVLEGALPGDRDRALVAAAELARLGDPAVAPALDALAARWGGTGDGAMAAYAAAVSRGEGATVAAGVAGDGV